MKKLFIIMFILATIVTLMIIIIISHREHPLVEVLVRIKNFIGTPTNPVDCLTIKRIDRYIDQYNSTGVFPDILFLQAIVKLPKNSEDRFWIFIGWIEQRPTKKLHIRFEDQIAQKEFIFNVAAPEKELCSGIYENTFSTLFCEKNNGEIGSSSPGKNLSYEYSNVPVQIALVPHFINNATI